MKTFNGTLLFPSGTTSIAEQSEVPQPIISDKITFPLSQSGFISIIVAYAYTPAFMISITNGLGGCILDSYTHPQIPTGLVSMPEAARFMYARGGPGINWNFSGRGFLASYSAAEDLFPTVVTNTLVSGVFRKEGQSLMLGSLAFCNRYDEFTLGSSLPVRFTDIAQGSYYWNITAVCLRERADLDDTQP